jgi:hypothetical protein
MAEKKDSTQKPQASKYTIKDVMKITDDMFNLCKEKEYHPGAFVHGLIFTLEISQQSYNIPQQQLAEIKRDCRRYVNELVHAHQHSDASAAPTKK